VPKSQILDPTSSDSSIKQAHAETSIIQETKAYFASHGVNIESFKRGDFSDTVILVKNFPYGTTPEELKRLFEAHGNVTKLIMPPSGTIAIIAMDNMAQARAAFGVLAYRKFKDSVLFLEKAPKGIFEADSQTSTELGERQPQDPKPTASDLLEKSDAPDASSSSTLFIRNLNFTTTTEKLAEAFRPLDGFLSARVKTRADPKKPGEELSMGFGFAEFRTKDQAQAALAAMNDYRLEGHNLVIKASRKRIDAAEERRQEDNAKKVDGQMTKVIIKNLPFEASKRDVRSLFSPYGQLRSVRVPRKFDNSTRGFAFAEFVSAKEAENAMDALRGTHLLGRRLVLEFAAGDAIDPEEEIQRMQQKIGSQAGKVALQRLTSTGRKKLNLHSVSETDE
jgi:multiple RNA-binding domain-containing protein 1